LKRDFRRERRLDRFDRGAERRNRGGRGSRALDPHPSVRRFDRVLNRTELEGGLFHASVESELKVDFRSPEHRVADGREHRAAEDDTQ